MFNIRIKTGLREMIKRLREIIFCNKIKAFHKAFNGNAIGSGIKL